MVLSIRFGRRRKRTSRYFWTIKFWPWWNQKKWKCWYLFRTWHSETRCKEARASEYWKSGYTWHTCVKKTFSSILWQPEIATKFDLMMTTNVENYSSVWREWAIFRSYPKTRALAAVPQVQLLDRRVMYVHTERLVNDIHNHKAVVRSNDELLGNLQESQRNGSYQERKVTQRSKQTWAAPGMKETRADSLSLIQRKASLNTRKTIPTNEIKWITIPIWRRLFPNRPRQCCVVLTKKNDRLMVPDMGFHQISIGEKVCTWARDFSGEAWLQKIFEGSTEENRTLQR